MRVRKCTSAEIGKGGGGGGGRRAINQQVKDVLGIFVPLYTCIYRCKTITKVQRMIRLTGFRVLRSFSLNAILI